jgi:uncharacterized repeat protein (TIGR03809 family)
MSKDSEFRIPAELSRKWQALAERRRDHFVELQRTGRWRKYYKEETFQGQMHSAMTGPEAWAEITQATQASEQHEA